MIGVLDIRFSGKTFVRANIKSAAKFIISSRISITVSAEPRSINQALGKNLSRTYTFAEQIKKAASEHERDPQGARGVVFINIGE